MQSNNSLLVVVVVLLTVVAPRLLALPITSKPFGLSPDHLAWDVYGGGATDDSLEPYGDGGYEKPKKILPKSIFIAPTLQNSLTTCGPGYTTDHRGNCIQTVEINHNQLLLNQLNQLLFSHQQQSQRPQEETDVDSYDYDYDSEPPATSPATKESAQKGPFQFNLPVPLDLNPYLPEPLRSEGTTSTTTTSTTTPRTTTTSTTTTKKPIETLTSFLDGLFSKDPFGLTKKGVTSTTEDSTRTETWPTTTQEEETTVEETTTILPSTVNTEYEVETTTFPDTPVTLTIQDDQQASSMSTSEFATELAREQLVPVTSTLGWDGTKTTTSDAEWLLSNAEGTTTPLTAADEVATETPVDTPPPSNGVIGTETATEISSSSSALPPLTTTQMTTEVTETVLPVQQVLTGGTKPLPTLSTLFSSPGAFDWRSRNPISIVTPVPNPFPFHRTSYHGGSSLFKFTVPVTTTHAPRTTTASMVMTTSTTEEAPPPVPESPLLPVENESENSHKMRESLIEAEQKEVNYENIDGNNRFIYHHLNGAGHVAQQPSSGSSPALQPIVVSEGFKIITEDAAATTTEESLSPSSTPTFTERLAAILHPKESERRPVTTTTTPPSFTTTQETTTSRFEDFLRTSSNRIRFPGPSVDRKPSPSKLAQIASRTSTVGEKDKKPFWWFPSGWEVDTKQKEKPVLLRFWTKMPLIPDSVVSRRRSQSHTARNNRENSKSPSDSLYREVAFQDISKAFQGGGGRIGDAERVSS